MWNDTPDSSGEKNQHTSSVLESNSAEKCMWSSTWRNAAGVINGTRTSAQKSRILYNNDVALARSWSVISYKLPVITSESKGKLLNWETFFNEHRVEHDSAEIKNLFLSYRVVIIIKQKIVQFQQLVSRLRESANKTCATNVIKE